MNLAKMRILVVAPHPDDEVIAAGGFIARVKAEGGSVYVLTLVTGTQEQFGSFSQSDHRVSELKEAARTLALDDFELAFRDEHHLKLDVLPQKELIDLIEKDSRLSILNVEPDIFVIPGKSYSQDHNAVHQACIAATRPYPRELKHSPSIILVYSHFDEQSWNHMPVGCPQNFWVDISDHMTTKEKALNCYTSQMKKANNHWRTVENILTINQLIGKRVGVHAAEEFICLRYIL
jgi:LmbE family N-acetylglucosaminyl deacetylase